MSVRITFQTCRELGFCTRGQREYCEASGLDYRDWMKRLAEGIPVEEVEHMDDARVAQLVAKAKEQAGGR